MGYMDHTAEWHEKTAEGLLSAVAQGARDGVLDSREGAVAVANAVAKAQAHATLALSARQAVANQIASQANDLMRGAG